MDKLKLIAVVVLALLTLAFVFQNTQSFEVKFLMFSFGFPGAVLLFAVLLVGFVVGMIAGARFAKRRTPKS
ncbi:MAG: DUF1049 domain-containing protein [Rhodopirellula sp.]|nr:DUF1049 domain-containing protein [Rhodopirellula sp.]